MFVPLIAALLIATPPVPDIDPQEAENIQEREEEDLVCRRRLIPSERIGERFRSQRVCRTREEWEQDSRQRRR